MLKYLGEVYKYTQLIFKHIKNKMGDFPGGPVAKTPRSQCRGPGFAAWSGN